MRLTDLLQNLLPQRPALRPDVDGVMVQNPVRAEHSHTHVPSTSLSDGAHSAPSLSAPAGPGLDIPCPDPTAEDTLCDHHRNLAQKLARQEDWDRLTALIAEHDESRSKTPAGMPVAELLAYGARADVVSVVEHAMLQGEPDPDAPMLDGIEAFESLLAERVGCPWTSVIVAMAHMDVAWAWRGTAWNIDVPRRHNEAFSAHFDRAADILGEHVDPKTSSPLTAYAFTMLSAGPNAQSHRIARTYEHLITLDPQNARAMRAYGTRMLPRWGGTLQSLELAARRNAGQTYDVWGAGGYTWVMLDAIACDLEAAAHLDYEFFIEGLHDIVRLRRDQHLANMLAAYCVNMSRMAQTGHDEADAIRHRIGQNADWIVRDHLREIHPMTWAHAARGFDNALRVRCLASFARAGLQDAEAYLCSLFGRELTAGKRIVFTKDGIFAEPASA